MKEVRFAPTPPMSSYLNVLVAGELDFIESRVGPTQIRVIATKGKAELGRYALEASAEILKYYNHYFGVKFPLPKLDQIAIPGGFGGAMENWGGITYERGLLLFDPKKAHWKPGRMFSQSWPTRWPTNGLEIWSLLPGGTISGSMKDLPPGWAPNAPTTSTPSGKFGSPRFREI